MQDNVRGTFLVRDNLSQPGDYFLSVRNGLTVKHYHIRREGTEGFYIIPEWIFSSVSELVQHYSESEDELCTQLTVPCPMKNLSTPAYLSYHRKDKSCYEIDRSSIKLKWKLREGDFSEVWVGTWNDTTPVAVKVSKPGSIIVSDFLAEVQIMKLSHENIVQLYATCTRQEPIYIVTEFMKYGNLLEYLTKGEGEKLKFSEMIDIGVHITNGMAYLESLHCIHGNLAARNILVAEHNVVKLANFSSARLVNDGEYITNYKEETAIRWMAPEVVLYNRFTIKSDIWSFGVLLTELVTHGQVPYPGMTDDEVFAKIKKGYHMTQPPECPNQLYETILNCWSKDPEERPTFVYLKFQLQDYFVESWERIYNSLT